MPQTENHDNRYRMLFENMLNGFADCKMIFENGRPVDFIYLDVNKAFGELTGLKDVIGKKVTEVIPAIRQSNPEILEIYGRVTVSGKSEQFETHIESLKLWLKISAYVLEKDRFVAVIDNITERKMTEQVQKEKEDLLRTFMDNLPSMVIIKDDQLRPLYFNKKFLDMFPGTEWLGKTPGETFPEEVARAMEGADRLALKERFMAYEEDWVDKNGGRRMLETRKFIIEREGKQAHLGAIITDITERKKAETALRESEEKFAKAFKTSTDSININRLSDGVYLEINEGFTTITGYTSEDVVGRSSLPGDLGIWVNQADRDRLVAGLRAAGEVIGLEALFRTKDGHTLIGSMSARILEIHGEKCILSTTRDITERKRAELALAAEKERLSVTLRSIGDGVITTDIHGNIVLMNRVAEDLCGWPLADAKNAPLSTVFKIINEKTRVTCENPVAKVLSSGDTVELANHTLLISRDGTERIIADSGAPIKDMNSVTIGVVLVFRDMTEKQKLLDNLQRADKLESIGVLAGGIAHDFNNLLSGIFGYIDLARTTCSPESKTADYLNSALKTFSRAKDLTQQLLTFAKGGVPIRKTGSLAPLIKESAQFALSGSNVSCLFHIADNLQLCDFDENQMGQVVDNIVINAVQAMPLGGKLTITAENSSAETHEVSLLKPGEYVHVSFADTGIGISPSIVPRIFDPFFTTKQKGNGLGLATVYSIVKKHDGEITVESELDKGTTFHLYLPVSEKDAFIQAVQNSRIHKGSGRVLVMDDEESIREPIGDMLRMMGYEVEYALDGEDALVMIHKAADAERPFLAVIMDITIPGGMGGKETIKQLRKTNKDVLVFVSSGYSEDPVMAEPVDYGFNDKIRKPFRMSELMDLFGRHLGDRQKSR